MKMTPETETASPSVGSIGTDGSYVKNSCDSDTTRKSSARNGGQGRRRVVNTGRGGRQGYDGRGGHFNRQAYTSSISQGIRSQLWRSLRDHCLEKRSQV